MKDEKLTLQILAVVLIGVLVLASQVIAAPRSVQFNEQIQTMNVSKTVPGQLNYQGYLADATDSSAVSATLEMTFRLYDAEVGGTELWSETHPAVEVSNGLFQVLLGSVTPFPAGLFDGTAMWLQTEVGAEALTPRKPLASVAYSQRSQEADHAVIADTAAYAQAAEMTFADSAAVAENAHRLEGQDLSDLDDRYVDEDDLDHLDAADGDPANAVYVDAAGRVGIGTTTPARDVHIYNDEDAVVGLEIQNPSTGSSSIEMITFTDENGGLAGVATYDDGSTYPSAMRIYNNRPNGNIRLATGSLERVRINNDGKVGIGTSAPDYLLDVNGSMRAATYWGDGSNLTGIAGAPDADWTISGSDMYSGVAGNVGIGTSTPGYPLHVYNYSAYSPSYAGYFNAVGHEATGNAYAVYADAQADDENAYGIYSTATSTWGQAYAGYFDGKVKADSLLLGSSSKVGMDGHLRMYRDGSSVPILVAGDYGDFGGEINLYDDDANWTIRLEPDVNGSGGFLEVERSAATYGFIVDGNSGGSEEPRVLINGSARWVDFSMDNPGDSSVILPTGAVSAGEIKDEPGVSNDLGLNYYTLSSGNVDYCVDTLSIMIPGPGYVEVVAGCYLNLYHSNGTDTRVFVNIDKTPANAAYQLPGAQAASVPSNIASEIWQFPCTTTRLYEETSVGDKTYYLNVDYQSGTDAGTNIARIYMRAKYFPTLYGTVTLAETDGSEDLLSSQSDPGDGSIRGREPSRRAITVEDHNARLEAEMAAMRAELEALKEEVNEQNRR